MSKRKRSEDNNFIEGLTSDIIQNKAATFSYTRGQEILDDDAVIIDSYTKGFIEASISGKSYSIEITFEEPVNNTFDIDVDCSCPDDRDGCCKHGCAVLLKVMDKKPKPKKRKTKSSSIPSNNSNNKTYTVSELEQSVQHLQKEHLVNIINQSLKYVCVQKIVSKVLNSVGNETINMSEIKSEIYEAIHQLDRLRPSQQFSMAYKVDQDLNKIVESAEKYYKTGNNIGAMEILLAIGKSISNQHNIEGEVWKSIHGCGGIDSDIAALMQKIVEADKNIQQNAKIQSSIESIHSILSQYCIEDYKDVLDCFETE
eukprot:280711_1